MRAIFSPLRIPLQALGIALAGVGLAWLWFNDLWWVGLLSVAGAGLIGWASDKIGAAQLPERPVSAVYSLQGWLLIPLALAAIAAAAVVIVTVELTLPDDTPTDTKELVGAVSTGITTFLTAVFISWASDDQNSTLAEHIMDAFHGRYTDPRTPKPGAHVFRNDSRGLLSVFEPEYLGVEGWGWPARLTRARAIAKELKDGTSEP
jgi:hypothetical protein